MADVFISYARDDYDRVKLIAEGLDSEGYTVWWDSNIEGGASYRDVIERQLESASCIVVVWSKSSVGRHFVRDEARRGAEKGILLPVRIDKIATPLGFGEIQTVDLIDWKGDPDDRMWRRFIDSLKVIVETPTGKAKPFDYEPPSAWKRYALFFAVAAIVLGAGAFLFNPAKDFFADMGGGMSEACRTTLWEEAKDRNTVGAYKAYIDQCPRGQYKSLAQYEMEALQKKEQQAQSCAGALWDDAKRRDTVDAYETYLEQCPDSATAQTARDRRRELASAEELSQACNSTFWEETKDKNTISGYESYIQQCRDNSNVATARRKIDVLKFVDRVLGPAKSSQSKAQAAARQARRVETWALELATRAQTCTKNEICTYSNFCFSQGGGCSRRSVIRYGDSNYSYAGERYSGNSYRNGYGVEKFQSGSEYRGFQTNSKHHDYGVYIWSGGDRYEGQYRFGEKGPHGVYKWPTGAFYEGEFSGHKFNGWGVMTYSNGRKTYGKYRDDKLFGDFATYNTDGSLRSAGTIDSDGKATFQKL